MKNDSFFQKVYQVVRRIPEGKCTTYGAIAEYLGSKGSARMVGWAMNNSHTQLEPVPAHRVVNRKGMFTGKNHFADPNMMQNLLEQEGIVIQEDQIQNFTEIFWTPQ